MWYSNLYAHISAIRGENKAMIQMFKICIYTVSPSKLSWHLCRPTSGRSSMLSLLLHEMTEAFTAGVMIFIEQFRARWPWSIGVLESWLSMSSSSEVPAFSILRIPSPRAELILQPFHHFTYITTHSPTLLLLYLMSQLILQLLRCFTYVTDHSPTILLLLLRHKLFT